MGFWKAYPQKLEHKVITTEKNTNYRHKTKKTKRYTCFGIINNLFPETFCYNQ